MKSNELVPDKDRSPAAMTRWVIVYCAAAAITVGLAPSCSPITVRTDAAQSATDPAYPPGYIMHRFVWGFFPLGGDFVARDCQSGSLQSISISANLWEVLVTAATLGLYCPVDVSYLCAKQSIPESPRNTIKIEPIHFGVDTLMELSVGFIRQTASHWEWMAWLTNTFGDGKISFTVRALDDTVAYLAKDLKNQIEYSIGFISMSDPPLQVRKKDN